MAFSSNRLAADDAYRGTVRCLSATISTGGFLLPAVFDTDLRSAERALIEGTFGNRR